MTIREVINALLDCEMDNEFTVEVRVDDSCAEAFGYWQDYYDPSTLGYIDGELNEYASVIAWMPLPEPYKEGESE